MPRARSASAPPAGEALEASGLAWWEFDVSDGRIRLSGLWNERLGGARVPMSVSAEELFALVPDEERAQLLAVFKPAELLRRADAAMYESKLSAKGGFRFAQGGATEGS